ncbi:MAG: UvrD-helicase domain-containing protein [Candidatus Vogelbacteria bacterium]|nr:UvrD-helicase domain-containing protein [Candidatus Vogelbacteria bacterium]
MEALRGLNSDQQVAAEHRAGPLLIVAGAGAGKTKTIVARILRLIETGIAPEQILAITFTNKAAGEMRERVRTALTSETSLRFDLGNPESKGRTLSEVGPLPFVSTFHALGVYLLRAESQATGLGKYFSIFDKEDSLRVVKEVMKTGGLDPKQIEPRKILGRISRAKGNGVNWTQFQNSNNESYFDKLVIPVWRAYEIELRARRTLDFDDLLLKTAELLEANPLILKRYQDRWRYIHIDEYQDTNEIQYRLARLLAVAHQNICVVGDVDQSIYSWRGADCRNILRFEEDYPKAKVVLLEQNYRSTKNILEAANVIIKKNFERQEKNLFTNNPAGDPIKLWVGLDEKAEAALVAEEGAQLIESGVKPEDIAVLYRTNFQSRAIEEAMLARGLPYQVLGTRFFERQEVKDVLAYLKAALNPEDIESAKRIINLPPRGVGKGTLVKLYSGQAASLPAKMREKISEFQKLLGAIRERAEAEPPSSVLKFIIQAAGLEKLYQDGTEEGAERLANIKELVTLALRYDVEPAGEAVHKLITDAALASDQDTLKERGGGIKLMTVHTAKGLEFRYVFITGLEQNLFPSGHLDEDGDRDHEEERRLFYVALTRAKERLYLTYAQVRTIFGSRQFTLPSEFLTDIPPHLVESRDFLIDIGF